MLNIRIIVNKFKNELINILEKSPYGYLIGFSFISNFNFLLPHESDYIGFKVLKNRGYGKYYNILDLGANAGHSARAFLILLKNWSIFSVEANNLHQKKLEQLKRNNSRFNYLIGAASENSNVSMILFTPVINKIILHSATSLHYDEAFNAAYQAYPSYLKNIKVIESHCTTMSVDELSQDFDFVKLDIQGNEYPALIGMKNLINRCQPILLIEFNADNKKIHDYLSIFNYEPWTFDVYKNQFISGNHANNSVHYNIFYAHKDHRKFFI